MLTIPEKRKSNLKGAAIMDKADTDNGYTKIANQLLVKICCSNLTQNEMKVLLAIARLSYGWNQKDTASRAGSKELREITGLFTNQIYLVIKNLKARKIIAVTKKKQNTYKINTYLSEWQIVTNHYQSRIVTSNESLLVTNHDYDIVTNHDYDIVTNHDYDIVTNHYYATSATSAPEAADQTPKEIKEIKEIKERKESEILPSDYYQKTLKALGLPSTGIISPKDHTVLIALLKDNCNFDDIEQARIKRKKNRLEWIQDTVCEMRDARLATVAKPDENGIPILPSGCMDWDNMTFEQKQFAIQRGYEK